MSLKRSNLQLSVPVISNSLSLLASPNSLVSICRFVRGPRNCSPNCDNLLCCLSSSSGIFRQLCVDATFEKLIDDCECICMEVVEFLQEAIRVP